MLPMICADIFFVSVERCILAFSSIGMIIAKEGASMKWTNEVLSKACRQGTVFAAGSAKAPKIMGEISENKVNQVTLDTIYSQSRRNHY